MSPQSYDRFVGKIGIVTGAGGGIGAAIARALASEGSAVTVVDRTEDAVNRVAAEIERAGGQALPAVGSVTSAADAGACRRDHRPTFRGVDLLVNNAGVVIYGEVPEFTEEDWDTVLDTNLKGCFLMAKFSIPEMRKRGGGAMVNMASVQALISQRQVAAPSVSKGGVVSLTKTSALHHATENIRVNSVLPGSVPTPMLERAARLEPGDPEEKIAEWGRIHPLVVP